MKTSEESFKADFAAAYSFQNARSTFQLRLYSPFRTTYGEIHLTPKAQIWKDSDGEFMLARQKSFQRWFQAKTWWQELAFIFNQPIRVSAPNLWADTENRIRRYERDLRTITCHPTKSRICELEDRDLHLKLTFTSLSCGPEL